MKTTKTIGGSLVLAAAAAGYALRCAIKRVADMRVAEQEQFEDCALCTFEGEGGLVTN